MRDPLGAGVIFRTVRKAIRVPFTIKIRGGWDDHHVNAVEIASIAESEGIDAITIHPRTRSQQFTGRAPWEVITSVVDAVDVPVIGNGDVASVADAAALQRATGCHAVMIGRAAQGRPWFPGQMARTLSTGRHEHTPQLAEQFTLIDTLYDEMLSHHGLKIGRRHARKHLAWALDSAAASAGVPSALLKSHRARVLTAEEPAQARRLLADAYDAFAWKAAA